MSDEAKAEAKPTVLITFNSEGSAEYTLEVSPKVTANQLWVVARYLDFWADQVHQERRLSDFLARQKQMEMENQPKIFVPEPKLSKPS